ncbi:hypothetical protein [Sphingomonas sp. Leaf21]|uniref:hypothetical protein n=1 Tax=Sphingomonas sp. Leaf21 TaxID=2876550 RepID=UPI001E3A98D7|nr:hypothetical protein [Sphingomonas sp. Leaf21]
MRPNAVYATAVGVSVFLLMLLLDALHIAVHWPWRAALVGLVCSALMSWARSKRA